MKKIITKKLVIEALKKEPLRHGNFWSNSSRTVKPNCDVCAVGAVLRRASFEKKFNGENAFAIGNRAVYGIIVANKTKAIKLIKKKNYMGALSAYFESFDNSPCNLQTPLATKTIRRKCIKFVKKYFPEKFVLEIKI